MKMNVTKLVEVLANVMCIAYLNLECKFDQ